MDRDISLLVIGLGPFASCLARMALLSGCGVALFQPEEPKILRRRMSYADAWFDGAALLAEVEARVMRSSAKFQAALRGKSRIPVLAGPLTEGVGRWPWDVIVDARVEEEGHRVALTFDAPLRINLGPGAIAGKDYDMVIATGGPDPGRVLREGGETPSPTYETTKVAAPVSGVFHCAHEIGDWIGRRFILGAIDGRVVLAPMDGRLVGQRRSGAFVRAGEPVAEIARDETFAFEGLGRTEQLVARAVLFAIEMDIEGWTPRLFPPQG